MMARYFNLCFEGTDVVGRAILLDGQAPKTCRTLWERLPYAGDAGHAMLSGTVCAFYIDSAITVELENATSSLETGDLVFVHYDEGERHGHLGSLSEICWTYDRYGRAICPGMMRPVYANVFGRFLPGSEPFFEMSRRIRRQGPKRVVITGETT